MTRTHAHRATIEAELADLYGPDVDWLRETGVVHVAAIGARPRAALALGPAAPASPTDRFVLGFARARADAIVTTGAILRAEPDLVHRASDAPDEDAAWRAWRAERLARRVAPECVVVSQSGQLPRAHPALRGPGRATVVTTGAGRARLEGAALPFSVVALEDAEVGTGPEDLLSAAIAWLRRARGAETVVVEAGPRSTVGLYLGRDGDRAITRVDELLLSLFRGDAFEAVPGPTMPETAVLAACFGGAASPQPRSRRGRQEPSGAWEFERYRRGRPGEPR
ncbi:MAG: hypothetical protein U0900_14315 [Myxococcota bacterium]